MNKTKPLFSWILCMWRDIWNGGWWWVLWRKIKQRPWSGLMPGEFQEWSVDRAAEPNEWLILARLCWGWLKFRSTTCVFYSSGMNLFDSGVCTEGKTMSQRFTRGWIVHSHVGLLWGLASALNEVGSYGRVLTRWRAGSAMHFYRICPAAKCGLTGPGIRAEAGRKDKKLRHKPGKRWWWFEQKLDSEVLFKVKSKEFTDRFGMGCLRKKKKLRMTPRLLVWGTERKNLPVTEMKKAVEENFWGQVEK